MLNVEWRRRFSFEFEISKYGDPNGLLYGGDDENQANHKGKFVLKLSLVLNNIFLT